MIADCGPFVTDMRRFPAKIISYVSILDICLEVGMNRLWALLLLLLVCAAPAGAAELAGTVKALSGSAFLVRQGQQLELAVGTPIMVDDRLVTRAGASLGVVLQDDTTLSLGPESELLVNNFVFAPKESSFAMVLKLLKGTFLYVSGVIGKLAPNSIELETPDSTIAVRGTRLLVEVSP